MNPYQEELARRKSISSTNSSGSSQSNNNNVSVSPYQQEKLIRSGVSIKSETVKPVTKYKTGTLVPEIKANPKLENMVLVKQSRLSTQPVTADEWKIIKGFL